MSDSDRNILYIMVIGFHHKKGCQLEFVYPLDENIRVKSAEPGQTDSVDLYELPKKWKHLPSLALPDGSHNYDQDYIYFHLEDMQPSSKPHSPSRTLFGVSCYRQINASELLNKDSDVTRNTLQKSVCILSRLPLYSSLRLKLFSITTAYFAQKDFHKTQLLINAFTSLTQSYTDLSVGSNLINQNKLLADKSKFYMGLSLADLVLRYQHKILVLFKLLLLQKKCLFQLKPVSNLSNTIMSLVSLIPDIFFPNSQNQNGLFTCSGFFDSIDLVNSELERKNRKSTAHPDLTVVPMDKLNKKMHRKKLKSFSSKKHPSIPSSVSTPSIKTDTIEHNSILSSISSNTQKLFSFKETRVSNANANLEFESELYKLTNDEKHDFQPKLDLKSNIYASNRSSTSSLNNEPEENHQIGELIKSKVTNVFKLVDWSAGKSIGHKQTESDTQSSLSDLLEFDFGMPLNLFNEFNILHPYLSLYYLDYFTMINKMSTKLYCTTALMMNMMKENKEEKSEIENTENLDLNSKTDSNEPYNPLKKKPEPKTVGYTIGATNVLFKQRLYDELDAFIEETDIDLKNNEQLKKQLQLSTADLRFADYIIKNVNASRSLNEKQQTTPTLLSFRKTSSFSNFDKKASASMTSLNYQDMTESSAGQSSGWEGSDDWIRVNFKWYLYSLLGSIVKEEVCARIKAELENILVSLNSDLSSSSTDSLENEVVDIDDYIEKVNSDDSKHKEKKTSKNRKNSESSVSSAQYFYLMQSTSSFSSYREDFNSNFINEFKKTECFELWHEQNREKLEKNLLKFDSDQFQQLIQNKGSADSISLNHRFQSLFAQLQELEQSRLSHPFNGQISVNDIKLRFNFLVTTTESGRKLNKALAEGSKMVNNTGKAVGDVFSQAKSSFSSFLSNWSSSAGSSSSSHSNSKTSKSFMKI